MVWFLLAAAGNFLYIAASNLLPQLRRHCVTRDSILLVSAMLLGMGMIVLVMMVGPTDDRVPAFLCFLMRKIYE